MKRKNFTTYISRLYLENYKCFSGINELNFLNDKGELVQWSVILGDNNSGKTNILKAIADLEPRKFDFKNNNKDDNGCAPLNLFRSMKGKVSPNPIEKDKIERFVGLDILHKKYHWNDSAFSKNLELYIDPKKNKDRKKKDNQPDWGFTPDKMWKGGDFEILHNLKIYGYGVTRRTGKKGLSEDEDDYNSKTLFETEETLINIEDWLLQLDYSHKNNQEQASKNLEKIRSLIKSDIFPELNDFRFTTSESLKNYIEFKVGSNWVKLEDLGYGYQSTLSWIIDFCKKLIDRYPNSKNPLAEPAVIVIDEIDLHLHPSWQKNVVDFLSRIFIKTQFIVTTHSPQIIQSLEKLNLFLLSKSEQGVQINKSNKMNFQGWSIEEILEDTMKMDDKIYSFKYKSLLDEFDSALDNNNKLQAKKVYKQLNEIIHPNSSERKLLKIQMSQILPDD